MGPWEVLFPAVLPRPARPAVGAGPGGGPARPRPGGGSGKGAGAGPARPGWGRRWGGPGPEVPAPARPNASDFRPLPAPRRELARRAEAGSVSAAARLMTGAGPARREGREAVMARTRGRTASRGAAAEEGVRPGVNGHPPLARSLGPGPWLREAAVGGGGARRGGGEGPRLWLPCGTRRRRRALARGVAGGAEGGPAAAAAAKRAGARAARGGDLWCVTPPPVLLRAGARDPRTPPPRKRPRVRVSATAPAAAGGARIDTPRGFRRHPRPR